MEKDEESKKEDEKALIRVLGKGAYGKVFLVRKVGGNDNGKLYAMKVLKKERVAHKQKTLEHTLAERSVLERLKGVPFLVNMIYAFQSEFKLHIVMEFVGGGELFTHLCKMKRFDLKTSQFILAELVIALDQIHRRNVIYRDLKLENILLDTDGHIKLTDFGLSKDNVQINPASSYCGTIEYMAPEIVKRTPQGYTESVDWWSLGVIAFEVLTGCSPFTVDGDKNSTQDIARRILTKAVPFPKGMNDAAKSMISGLLEKDAKRRLGAGGVDQIKSHPFFMGINWSAMEQRKLKPPLKPKVSGKADVANFADEFTNQVPLFTPTEAPCDYQGIFAGYSFVSPSVIFSKDNVIGEEFLEEKMKLLANNSFFSKYELDTSPDGYLGRGAFSICRKCRRLQDNQMFAVKIVSAKFASYVLRELRILEHLGNHPHIVKVIEALSDPLHYYIVLELLEGGELLKRVKKMNQFTELQASKIMAQIVSAVIHLHAKGVVHRDLKPENILFENQGPNSTLRLIDFGFARLLPNSVEQLSTPCFTLHYAAPEVLEIEDELPQYNQQCDLWSLGFTMLSGKVPFHAKNKTESATDIISRIRTADYHYGTEFESVSETAKDLITGLLTVDPKKRLSLNQLANHPWLTQRENTTRELQTPTILPSTADESFNETYSAFLTANRDGFQLMDVDTAPLLVKRRGLKRRMEDPSIKDVNGRKVSGLVSEVSKLATVPEGSEPESSSQRPTTLKLQSPAFTEIRDTRPPYLKYSRDDTEA